MAATHRGGEPTPAERDGYRTTPDYAETVRYLEGLAAAHPDRLRIEGFGTTGQGRELKIAIAAKDGLFDPDAAHRAGRVVLLVQNAIHAGEMDGKDACLALLRDLAVRQPDAPLLDRVVLVVIPIYNADGHERRSPYGRINQNGPETYGWRANATNLNLNRDYLKADAPETRAFLRLIRRWSPDFFVDDHVTDGADFEYDVTFSLDATPNVAPATASWIRERVTPELARGIDAAGHLAFPSTVFLKDDADPAQGFAFAENPPRFSTGYMILRGRPGLLVELHMRKPYRARVEGNYALLRTLLATLEKDADRLIRLNREADAAAESLGAEDGPRVPFPLGVSGSGTTTSVRFRGYRYTRRASEVSGATMIEYGSEPEEWTIPVETGARVTVSVLPPAGYIVPPEWSRPLDVLLAHGVVVRRTRGAWKGPVGRYRCSGMQWPGPPYEGRHPILGGSPVDPDSGRLGECRLATETLEFPAGSAVISLRQPLARVVLHWLEPIAPDSALRWGFFDAIFEQKEFGEGYVLERFARDEMARDPVLRSEFEARLAADPGFAASSRQRLAFFFDRSPHGQANRVGEYPVGRLASLAGLPIEGSEDAAPTGRNP